MANKIYKLSSVFSLLFFAMFCVSVVVNFELAYFLNEYEEQIERQDSMINSLTISKDIVKEYFDIKEDSAGHIISYTLKDEKRDKIIERVTKYTEPVVVRNEVEMSLEEYVTSVNEDNDKFRKEFDELVSKYNFLVNDYNGLKKRYISKSDSVMIQGMALGLIKRNYDIDYVSNKDGDVIKVSVVGNKVDSALILLSFYRHNLSYNPETKEWVVTYDKKKK